MFEIAAILLGLITGSFLNVCMLRLPKEESVVFPASHCVHCRKPIAWFDNVPLVSFLLLKGKCRHCGVKISWQYFIVEAVTGVLFVVFYRFFGFTAQGVVYLILSLALLVQSVIDARHKIIPDEITLPGIVAGIIFSAVFPQLQGQTIWWRGLLGSAAGVLAGGGFLFLVGTLAEWVLKKEAMGGGDVKLLAMVGSVIGVQGVFWTVFCASLVGSVIGIYFRWKTGDELIPFGPYLAFGAFSYLFVGQGFIQWYFRYFVSG